MMKKLIFAACGAVALTACNKTALLEEARPVPTKAATETAATVTVRDGKLCFADEAAIEKTLSMLLGKDEQALAAWYDSLGFVSQEMAREAALEEFRSMSSLDEYPAFKAKYQGRFLFNDNLEEEDYQPYVAANRFAYEMILNADGDVIVGGQTVNYNYDSFEQTMYYRVAHAAANEDVMTRITQETKTNQVFVKTSKKKCWAWAYLVNDIVYIQVTAQKKNLFGWNDYKAEYYFTFANRDYNETLTQNWKYISSTVAGETIGQGIWTDRISCNSKFEFGRKADMSKLSIADLTVMSSGTKPSSGWLHIEL